MVKSTLLQQTAIGKFVEEHGGDALRQLMQDAVQKLMSSEADSLCHADFGSRSGDRTNQCNGC